MENVFELKGTIYEIKDLKEFGDNGYKKREFLFEYESGTSADGSKKYTEIIKLVTDNQRADGLAMYNKGEEIKVGFAVKGRMWTSPDKGDINFTELKVVWMQKLNVAEKPNDVAVQELVDSATVDDVTDLPF